MIQITKRITNAIILVLASTALVNGQAQNAEADGTSKEQSRRAELERRDAGVVRSGRLTDPGARDRFLQIERIARLSHEEQIAHLPHLYHDLAPRYMSPFVTGILSSYRSNILENSGFANPGADRSSAWANQLSEAAGRLDPEVVAYKIGPALWLNVASRVRCIQVLKDHRERTMELIDADLDSGRADRVDRAASTILALELRSYSMRLLEMLLAAPADAGANNKSSHPLYTPAGRTLLFMHDPNIVPVLLKKVEREPRLLVRVAGLFQHGLYHKPANPMLLALAKSPDRQVSYHAAYALAECKDAALAPLAAEFAADTESRFRWLAGHWSLNLPDKSFLSIRKDLLPLLKDEKEDVFEQALRCFTRHRDPEAGKVILDMLKKNKISGQLEVTTMQCLSEMGGSTFGYNMHNWGPDNDRNSEAIEKLESWLKDRDRGGNS